MENNNEYIAGLLRKLAKLNYIKPGDVPNIDLYMDQVTTFMDAHLSDVKRYDDDKILTKTMINNYTKNNLLPPPAKKKYSQDHIYLLAFIYYFKNMLSISDIQTLLNPLTTDFFGEDASLSLDNIYKEIYRLQKEQISNISKDVFKKYQMSTEAFPHVSDTDDQEYLQLFSFVTLLSFDVYMKKNIIENIIDGMIQNKTAEKESPKKESKKEAKNESKNESKKTDK